MFCHLISSDDENVFGKKKEVKKWRRKETKKKDKEEKDKQEVKKKNWISEIEEQ